MAASSIDQTAKPKKKSRADIDFQTAVVRTITELLFIALPFVVAIIVFSYKGALAHLIYLPEWGIAATLLQGQVLVRFISGLFMGGSVYNLFMERMPVVITGLIVFLFVPTLVILCFVLFEEPLTRTLAFVQMVS